MNQLGGEENNFKIFNWLGIISNVTAESMGFGPVAPFVVALVPLLVCGVMVINTWEENYGDRKSNFGGSCMEGLRIIFSDSQVGLHSWPIVNSVIVASAGAAAG